MPRRHGGTGLHSLSTCGNGATARRRGLFPRCASCGNAGAVQAVALRLKINLCAAATEAEEAAKSRLCDDKSDRWLYLAARGKLELQLLLEIRRYERIGSRKGYKVCGLKKTDIELAEFFNAARPSVCKARKALKSRHLIDSVDGILQLRYAAILDAAKSMGWSD